MIVPTVKDRVVQAAAKLVLEPIFEADFQPCSFGFRPKRSACDALEVLREQGKQCNHVLDADIRNFEEIDHDKLMKLIGLRVKRKGRQLKAGETARWSRDYFHALGLHRLRRTVRYPGAA